jgi:hypothetical protein
MDRLTRALRDRRTRPIAAHGSRAWHNAHELAPETKALIVVYRGRYCRGAEKFHELWRDGALP